MLYIFLGIATLIDLLIAIYVFIQNTEHIVNRSFFIFVIGISILSSGMLLLSGTRIFFFDKFILYGGHLMNIGFFMLSQTFPSKQRLPRRFFIYLVPWLFLGIITPFNLIIRSTKFNPSGYLEPMNGSLFPLFAAIVGIYALWSLASFFGQYRKLTGLARLQMQYFLWGGAFFIVSLFVFDVLLPAFQIFQLNWLGPLSSIVFIAFTGYAIVRHQLMDIRVVIQRSAIYSVLFGLIALIYLGIIFFLQLVFDQTTNTSVMLSAGFAVALGIFGVPPLERYFQRMSDKIFFKDKYEYSEALYTLSEILNQNLDFEALVRNVIGTLKGILKVRKAALVLLPQKIVLGDHEGWSEEDLSHIQNFFAGEKAAPEILFCTELSAGGKTGAALEAQSLADLKKLYIAHGIAVIIPLIEESVVIGVLAIGKKLSGDPFTEEDARLLKTFSYQAAVALKKAELYKKVKDHSEELELRVKERTAKLERLQEEQHNMMADISHSLQTPLTIVKGELDILKKQLPPSRDIQIAQRSIDQASRLTYDLLKLARFEANQTNPQRTVVDLSQLLNDTVEYFTLLAGDRNIEVISTIAPNVRLLGESGSLEELITNLLSNAVKYMPREGSKKVYIDLAETSEEIRLTIRDTGIGIRSEDLSNIFKRFYRVRKGQGEEAEGTGLGLAICKAIVQKHGGNISAESESGRGTTFTVTFPAVHDGSIK